MVTDSLPALAIGNQEIPLENVKKRQSTFLLKGSGVFIFISTLLAALATGSMFLYGLNISVTKARTLALTACIVFELLLAYSCQEKDVFSGGIFANKWLSLAVCISFILQLLILYTPFLHPFFGVTYISIEEWLVIFMVCIPALFIKRIENLTKKLLKI